jgi:type IV secretory pathway TraG/TraD family ATPase VirD4
MPASDEDVLIVLLRLMMTQFLKVNMRHLDTDNRGRPKRHDCLIVADEFPALKKMKIYELLMKRFAQYRIKSFKTVQSFNDIIASYGRDNTILDNCFITVSFASADETTQKKLSGMLGKDTEYRTAENFQGSRFGFMLNNKSVITHEVHREIVDQGGVRELDPDHEYVLVTGFPKFKAEKVKYDQEIVFQQRLLPAAEVGDGLGHYPDLPGKVEIEWLGMRATCPPRRETADHKKTSDDSPPAKGRSRRKAAKSTDDMMLPLNWPENGEPSAPTVTVPQVLVAGAEPRKPRRKRTLVIEGDRP